ncbi:MAG: hypothetical protein NUV92_07115 [Ignavibacteria bacterium]|jgi:hypothetical protein|nr:hypothetical protein [Ignavibacteria bacterium]MDH7528262.1 hypothetical protein [Ignavibacteria bacterium]
MGTNNIEKLLTDLKNLPKQCAPEGFEQKLLERIHKYENSKTSGESIFRRFIITYYNPIYVPALTIILVAVLIVYTVSNNQIKINSVESSIEKAIPVIQETQQITKTEPQKISVPKKRDYVVKRDKINLNLGPGINLDERDYSSENENPTSPTFVNFPFPDEPITIRIPPPEVIFKNEMERLNNFNHNKDSIRMINSRRK